MSEIHKKLYPLIDEKMILIPRRLSTRDKSRFIVVSPPYHCQYYCPTGKRQSKRKEGSIRASVPIPYQCYFYYYELAVLGVGESGRNSISIGLTSEESRLQSLPGWEKNTIGYHGDDGNIFSGKSSVQVANGPEFGIGDVVGCGINMRKNVVIFTKNGKYSAIVHSSMENNVRFPTIGMDTDGGKVEVNFGQKPYRFDPSQSDILLGKWKTVPWEVLK